MGKRVCAMGTHSPLFLLPSFFFFFSSSFFFSFISSVSLITPYPLFTTTHLHFILSHILSHLPSQFSHSVPDPLTRHSSNSVGSPDHHSQLCLPLPPLTHSPPARCTLFSSSLTFSSLLDSSTTKNRYGFPSSFVAATSPHNPIALQPKTGSRPKITRGRSVSIDLLFMHQSSNGKGRRRKERRYNTHRHHMQRNRKDHGSSASLVYYLPLHCT